MAKSKLHLAIELMAKATGATFEVSYARPTIHAFWALKGRLDMPDGSTYEDVARVLDTWDASDELRALVGIDRTSRIIVNYVNYSGNDARHDSYTLAEIGPWDGVVGRAIQTVDGSDRGRSPLIIRYGMGDEMDGGDDDGGDEESDEPDVHEDYISSITVWFGSDTR